MESVGVSAVERSDLPEVQQSKPEFPSPTFKESAEDLNAVVARVRAEVAEDLLPLIKVLWGFYDTWMNKVDCYDPGDLKGIASLLGTEGAFAMNEAEDAVQPHEERIRALLAEDGATASG